MKRFSRWMGCFGAALTLTILFASATHSLPDRSPQAVPVQMSPSPAATFPELREAQTETLQVTIADDPADLYLPTISPSPSEAALPVALMLPGALVDRTYYSQFARAVAGYGFAVVVPTHIRSLPEFGISGELAEASQIPATLAFLERENANPTSPLYRKLNPSQMALLGHSHGGFVGLQAIANACMFPFCSAPFSRPDAVKAGIFYGVNSEDPRTGIFSPTANRQIPVALAQGSLDGIATPGEAIATYDLIQTPPKALITIQGSNHYGITDRNNPPGAMPDPSSPTLEQAQGVETIAQWTAYFLRAHLYQDSEARQRIYGSDCPDALVTITSVLE